MKRNLIYTRNKELYEKLNSLHFIDRIVLETVSSGQVNKIVNSINKKNKIVEIENKNNKFILTKVGRFDCNIYLTKK